MFNFKRRAVSKDQQSRYGIENLSFSQAGEDRVLWLLFYKLGIDKPFFIDVGAHHPSQYNNTYLFYLQGARGINIEADKDLITPFYELRRDDINLNVAISNEVGTSEFFKMSSSSLNTLSRGEAKKISSYGTHGVDKVEIVSVATLETILSQHCKVSQIDLLSIDVEGMEDSILRSLSWNVFRPSTLCVETMSYRENKEEQKNDALIAYLQEMGYMVYADTFVNTIFVEQGAWERRLH